MQKAWENWKNFAKKAGDFQLKIVFSIIYFFIISPLGISLSLFKDFLEIKGEPRWSKAEDNASTLKKLRNQ